MTHRRAIAGQGGAWTPPADCVMWLSAKRSGAVSAGGVWQDQSGNANHCTLYGDASVSIAGGLTLDGNGDYGAFLSAPVGSAPRTMCAWTYRDASKTGPQFAIGYGRNATKEGWGVVSNAVYVNNVYLWTNSNDAMTASNTLPAGEWHHVAITYAGGTPDADVKIYVDGQALYSGKILTVNTLKASYYIGRAPHNTTENWKGALDEIMIFSRALSPEDVAAITANPYTR